MHFLEEASSLIQEKELVNGGKLDSTENTGLTKSRSSIEEIAVVIDSPEPRFSLMTNSVVK
jgi:hypothetical protein